MPLRDTSGFGERVPREMIEADFELAFNFVGMAKDEAGAGRKDLAARLLAKAEGLLEDIRNRLKRMRAEQREAFEPRCEELGRAIVGAGLSGESGT